MAHTEQPDQTPGKILDHGVGIGEANKNLVEERAKELAAIAGLSTHDVTDAHRAQARQELAGRADPYEANDDEGATAALIEPDDVLGQSGGATPPASNAAASGDEESIGEALYSEGVTEATHDQMVESRREEHRREA